jgi:hypothetical protein
MKDADFKLINYISNGQWLSKPPQLLACMDENQHDGENSAIFRLPYPDFEYTFLFCYRSKQNEQIGFDVCTSVAFPQIWDNLIYPKEASMETKIHFINGQQGEGVNESKDYDRKAVIDFSIEGERVVKTGKGETYRNTESVDAIDFDVDVRHSFTVENHPSFDVIVEITPKS